MLAGGPVKLGRPKCTRTRRYLRVHGQRLLSRASVIYITYAANKINTTAYDNPDTVGRKSETAIVFHAAEPKPGVGENPWRGVIRNSFG